LIGQYDFVYNYYPDYGPSNVGSVQFFVNIVDPCDAPLINYGASTSIATYYIFTASPPVNQNLFTLDWIIPRAPLCSNKIQYSLTLSGKDNTKVSVLIGASNIVQASTHLSLTQTNTATISGEIISYPKSLTTQVINIEFERINTFPQPCSVSKVYPKPIP
jgi:hypothetical protein